MEGSTSGEAASLEIALLLGLTRVPSAEPSSVAYRPWSPRRS
jgi:hypothetical protein